LHPGAVKTEIIRDRGSRSFASNFVINVIFKQFVNAFGKTAKQGALTSIHCATSEDIPNQSGAYFDNSRVARSSAEARDEKSAERLWEISSKLVGLTNE
jgi:retinol dehydrogenase-12